MPKANQSSYPSKVTIEITADGYTTKVFAGDKVVSERSMLMEGRGGARGTKPGDIYDDLPDFDDLVDEIDGFSHFNIAY
jgi:hypothetical protein